MCVPAPSCHASLQSRQRPDSRCQWRGWSDCLCANLHVLMCVVGCGWVVGWLGGCVVVWLCACAPALVCILCQTQLWLVGLANQLNPEILLYFPSRTMPKPDFLSAVVGKFRENPQVRSQEACQGDSKCDCLGHSTLVLACAYVFSAIRTADCGHRAHPGPSQLQPLVSDPVRDGRHVLAAAGACYAPSGPPSQTCMLELFHRVYVVDVVGICFVGTPTNERVSFSMKEAECVPPTLPPGQIFVTGGQSFLGGGVMESPCRVLCARWSAVQGGPLGR
jgi:hypothetical protein